MAHSVIVAWVACKQAGKTPSEMQRVEDAVNRLIDDLIENYEGEVTPDEVRTVFSASGDQLSVDYLLTLPKAVVPVAVIRDVLNTHRVIFNPRAITNWGEVAQRYGQYVLAA